MKKLFTLTMILALCAGTHLTAQDAEPVGETFKPHGAPILKGFVNFHNTWQGNGSKAEFEVTRAYLGYEYQFNKNFYGRVILDVGDIGVGGFRNVAYLKNAYVRYRTGGFSAYFGMIGSNQFDLQEKVWGHRYIMKSYQDEYRFGPSADLGLMVDYKIADFVSVDVAFMNGEGYKLIQLDSTFKISGGATFILVKHLKVRGYYDVILADTNQHTIAAFIGWDGDRWSAGAEYNLQLNHMNENDKNLSGISVYGSFDISKTIGIYGRYDCLGSETLPDMTQPWNQDRDGQLVLAGFQYSPVRYVKVGPNFQLWIPHMSGISGAAYSAYLNVEFKL